jgi:predicted nucleic acid-binding protein
MVINIPAILPEKSRLFLDTAPIIYYVEHNPHFYDTVKPFFDHIDNGSLIAVTSPVTLAECLVIPIHSDQTELSQHFQELITHGADFVLINEVIGLRAAKLRASYTLTLMDAFQLAVAIETKCDAFLTNDKRLKQVKELQILVLSDLMAV